jgi:phosphopantothenoylcysteine decarboxylase/phosphopantothenate--cysteine ligase
MSSSRDEPVQPSVQSTHDTSHVLLGVTGGIAAYKSPEIVRRLRDAGFAVRVVMTRGAMAFITPLSLQAVSGHPVHRDLLDESAEMAMGHIELARWADVVLIAPSTANFIARLAHGFADDLLSTLCVATEAPIVLAPAMNQQMWANRATQDNLTVVRSRGVRLIGPASGDQACGEVGPGRMEQPDDIVAALDRLLRESTGSEDSRSGDDGSGFGLPLSDVRVVITAGPTREAIDPVRFISNHSSGKMGYAVAEAAHALGARVTLVSGPTSLACPAGVDTVAVESASDMYSAVMSRLDRCDIFIAAAAVADYAPARAADQKLKKHHSEMTIELARTKDILAEVAAQEHAPFTVGFAAETNDMEQYAQDKMARKSLDMIAGNQVGVPEAGFNADTNEMTVFWPGGQAHLEHGPKQLIAERLMGLVVERFNDRRSA